MKCSCHEGIVIRCIAQHHQLGTSERVAFSCHLSCPYHSLSHKSDSIHVDAGLGRTHIDTAAYALGACHCSRNGLYEKAVAFSHSLGNDCRISSEEIDANLLRSLVECKCNLHIIFSSPAACCTDQ